MAVRRIRLWRSTCRRSQFYRVFGLLPISIYDLQKFSRDMSWGFVPGTPSGIGWSIAAKWSIQNCGNRPSAVRKFIGRAVKDVRFWSRSDNTPKPVRCNTFCRYGVERSRRKVGPDTFGFADRPGRQLPAFGKSYAGYRCSRTAFDCSGRIEEFCSGVIVTPGSDFASST